LRPNTKHYQLTKNLRTFHTEQLQDADAIEALKIAKVIRHIDKKLATTKTKKKKPIVIQLALKFPTPKTKNLKRAAKRSRRKKKVKKILRKRKK